MYQASVNRRYQNPTSAIYRTQSRHKHIHRTPHSICDKDTICIVTIFICLFVYFLIFYHYINGNFVNMATHRVWPSDLIQRDLPLLYSIKTQNLPQPRASFMEWLRHPSSLCWNNENETSNNSIFVLNVLIGYSVNFKLLIRSNRMH